MSDIGKNIKDMRIRRKMTIKQLADRASMYTDAMISSAMIGYWESGKRRIYADQLEAICLALDCSPTNIFPNFVGLSDSTALERYSVLPQDERDIIKHCANTWHGNSKALVYFMGLYMALDKDFRKDLAEYGIWRYEEAIRKNHLDPTAPPIPIDYIREQADKIK